MQEALWLGERDCAHNRKKPQTQWQRVSFSITSTPLSQTLSPRKLLTELWQRIVLPLADKLSPVLYLTHSSRRGGVGDALFVRGAVTKFSSVLFLQLSSSSGVLTPPPCFHIHP